MKKKIMMTAAIAAAMTAAISFGTMAEENEKIEAGGLVFEIPAEYRDLVTVQTEGLQTDELIRVSETASIEAAKAKGESGEGAGWLFSISTVSPEELAKLRCDDMSGSEVFAEDDNVYYMFNHPTDVSLFRESNEEMDAAMDQWTALNDWAFQDVRMAVLSANPDLELETFSNTDLDMHLARAKYDGLKYEIRSLYDGTLDPTVYGEDDGLDDLLEDVWYEEVTDDAEKEKADGEYIVLAFDEDNVQFDFFLGDGLGDYIREVRTMEDGEEIVTLYKANFKDNDKTATGVMKEWIAELTVIDDDGDGLDD